MRIALAYGRNGLEIDAPDSAQVIRPRYLPGLPDEVAALRAALRAPIGTPALGEVVWPGAKVAIGYSDRTRATPNERILPVVLDELEAAGVRREDVTLICALGTHRQQTPAELRTLVGERVFTQYRCLQHDCEDDEQLVPLGLTRFGHPIRLNRAFMAADVRILTGFIEPHLFAGFSGGPKCVVPGLAGAESVVTNHGVDMIGHPKATWGFTYGNPLWEEMLDVAMRLERTFLLNVTLNTDRQITGVFAGDLVEAHRQGCDFVRRHAMMPVEAPFDVVITTNSGYPLDQNLYQSAKGMRAAEAIVRRGGAILIATACEDGLPNGGHYDALIRQAGSLEGIDRMLAQPGFQAADQWMLQIQAMIQHKAEVHVFSNGLSDEQIESALFIPCRNIEQRMAELTARLGPRMCILPEGPQVIAYLAEGAG